MKVDYTGHFFAWSVSGLMFFQGENDVPEDCWYVARKTERIQSALEDGVLVELEEYKAPKETRKPEKSLLELLGLSEGALMAMGGLVEVDLRDYHWNTAQDIVCQVDNLDVLVVWNAVEHRASVLKTLGARIGDLG